MAHSMDLALESLEKLRLRLLDLTGRNRLISFKHTKNASLRVIDELPNQLVQTLLADKDMTFLAVPEPTQKELIDAGYIEVDELTGQEQRLRADPSAEEWAKQLDLSTSYEVPKENLQTINDSRHIDKAIQTLLYPYELETRLKRILQSSESAIQEMGNNILYLAVGFLEWFDNNNDNARIAPLFLVPLRLHKGILNRQTNTYQYTLSYSGEDIIPNLSLREKLKLDFGLALPELDETTDPESYFTSVLELITDNQPRWHLRRFISLTLLNFSKMLMYLDLDPNNWPEGESIIEHPVVGQFLGSYDQGQAIEPVGDLGFGEEYAIDELEKVHENYPLIDDADSSQHSALIDAIDGKSLVIEGPPGTGKSQTITNLIGAAIAQGKSVLFVAEKLAALEVVKRRLDNANLGEFCLELHSHKSQKRKVIEEINNRLVKTGNYKKPELIEMDIARYEELKYKLKTHVERINSGWKQTGLSAHEIFMAATRYREEIGLNPTQFHPDGYDGSTFTPVTQLRVIDQIKAYCALYKAISAQLDDNSVLQDHPWYGVTNSDLQIFDLDKILLALNEWQASLESLENEWELVTTDVVQHNNNVLTIPDVISLLSDLEGVPLLQGNELLEALPFLRRGTLLRARNYLVLFEEIEQQYKTLAQQLDDKVLQDISWVEILLTGNNKLKKLIDQSIKLGTLAEAVNRLTVINNQLKEIEEPITHIQSVVGDNAEKLLSPSISGLNELISLIESVSKLSPTSWNLRNPLFDNDELDIILPVLRKQLEGLHHLATELTNVFDINSLPSNDHLSSLNNTLNSGGFFRWFSPKWRKARKEIIRNTVDKKAKLSYLQPFLIKAIEFSDSKQSFKDNDKYRELLGDHFKAMNTDLETIHELRKWYKNIRHQYGVGFGHKVALGDAIINLPTNDCRGIRSLYERDVPTQITKLLNDLSSLKRVFSPVQALQDDSKILIGESGIVSLLLTSVEEALLDCNPLMTNNDITIAQLGKQIETLSSLNDNVKFWMKEDLDNTIFSGNIGLKPGVSIDNTLAKAKLYNTLIVAERIEKNINDEHIKIMLYEQPVEATFTKLIGLSEQLRKASDLQSNCYDNFKELVGLNADYWMNDTGIKVGRLQIRNQLALEHPNELQNWLDYLRVSDQLISMGLSSLVKSVETSIIEVEKTEPSFYAGIYDFLAREILKESPELVRFSGYSQMELQSQFQTYDNKLKYLQREQIAWRADQRKIPPGINGARVSERTERYLLEHECSKTTRHIPIRQLIKRAGHALVSLKPCFMMGPMSAAQYLVPGQIKFDLVIMDEASQIKPQDALGVIARGTQLVVVGDPKQLPPTSFFDRLIDDDDDDPTSLQESESILDATLPMFPARRLRWHYRSQHESLIAFSNQAFYNSDLVIFPSPNKSSESYGIQYSRIQRGCFVNRRNMEEAKIIAESVREHFKHRKQETIGVVAMSADQRQQIERAIEVLAKGDMAFQQWLEQDLKRDEPLFIKNLENVQGDERDVIFISMTYGPQEPGGRVYQRFGPINSDVGWRRLNVLFTRSKKRMHIFSSMGSEDVLAANNSKRGVLALRDFLSYCETGILHNTVRNTGKKPDSDFEIAVMDALSSAGFECIPQVGVAGFFIDIAVVDPGNPGRYLMGIECDGATYHSAKSTRDRDRLRQTILERLGWKIRRIWSTDWFKNPHAELKPIIRELNELRSAPLEDNDSEAEVEEINEIIKEVEEQEARTQNFISETASLREKLTDFDQQVIRTAIPDTPDNQRLLRPAMLEAFLEFEPLSKEEFLEYIPGYLRQATCGSEGKYLDNIFEIINASL